MELVKSWNCGLFDYRECVLTVEGNNKHFTTIINDCEYESGRKLSDIFYDHIANRQTKYVEVLFSGGMDSELVLKKLLDLKIPTIVITMVLKYKDIIINTHDLYYSEKFCKSHQVLQKQIVLDVKPFFENGLYLEYLTPYFIVEPHVATHFWLIEQCTYFPILGGDWQYVQMDKDNKVLSPARLDYSCYELFMKTRGISGIGNMIGHSFESLCYFIKSQIENDILGENVAVLKKKMFSIDYNDIETRTRSYGWEKFPNNIFNINQYKLTLIKSVNQMIKKIIWQDHVKQLLNTSLNENYIF